MAVHIRLARAGKKHVPFYRVVAIDSRRKRDGIALATIGTYDALKGTIVQFDETLYQDWISKGAQPTDSALKVYRLFKKNGIAVVAKRVEAPQAIRQQANKQAGEEHTEERSSAE